MFKKKVPNTDALTTAIQSAEDKLAYSADAEYVEIISKESPTDEDVERLKKIVPLMHPELTIHHAKEDRQARMTAAKLESQAKDALPLRRAEQAAADKLYNAQQEHEEVVRKSQEKVDAVYAEWHETNMQKIKADKAKDELDKVYAKNPRAFGRPWRRQFEKRQYLKRTWGTDDVTTIGIR